MDFNKLMQTMRDLDRPVGEVAVEGCGDTMMGGMTPPMSSTPPVTPPSMSVNLNAQGMDSIESLLKLMTKVNPDMINQPQALTPPPMTAIPSIPSISSIGDLGNLDKGPLKMLPDLDKDEPHSEPDADNMGGPSDMDADNMPPMGDLDRDDSDNVTKTMGDIDGDGDHDMDDHDAEDDEEKKETFGNSVEGDTGPDFKGMSASIHDGTDQHREKGTFPKVAGGDNPMQRVKEGNDLRASIRAELQQRLAEAKGAK